MTEVFTWIVAHASDIIFVATSLVTAAAAITALTPSPKDDSVVAKIRSILDKIALNVGHAQNKDS